MIMLQKNSLYYLRFNDRLYFLQYKGETRFGHCFKSTHDNDTVYVGKSLLSRLNTVLWKVKK